MFFVILQTICVHAAHEHSCGDVQRCSSVSSHVRSRVRSRVRVRLRPYVPESMCASRMTEVEQTP